MKHLLLIMISFLFLNVSCKKETAILPQTQVEQYEKTINPAEPGESFTTFLKTGKTFNYKFTEVNYIYDTIPSYIDTVRTYTLSVTILSNTSPNYFTLDTNLPYINSTTLYSDENLFGTSPTEAIIPVNPIKDKLYSHPDVGWNKMHYYVEKSSEEFNGEEIDVYTISDDQARVGTMSTHLYMKFSPKYGVISSHWRDGNPATPNSTSLFCELVL